jgi:HD-GYP domain-containing protein (c-di-GMP phosphodiesterase class II)
VLERLAEREGAAAPWLADAVDTPGAASEAVADLAVRVGRVLGLDDAELADLRAGALFHDIGTLAVPLGVLDKPGRLTEHERAVVRDHVVFGERLLGRVPEMRGAARLVRHAHERVDGGGYPDGLAGTEIPLGSRILLACDAYVAMTSARPYRAALSNEQAIGELRRAAGTQLDADVVEVLLGILGDATPAAA